jgi:hypothetical protein
VQTKQSKTGLEKTDTSAKEKKKQLANSPTNTSHY